jgi:hypothetical protein
MQASPRSVIEAVIELNYLENELGLLGQRSQKREEIGKAIQKQRVLLPPNMIGHHDRMRARGRVSVVAVVDWVCRGCFISIPSGLRTHLATLEDVHICENCGCYQYIPDGTLGQKLIDQARKKAELASRPSQVKAKSKVPAKSKRPVAKKKASKPAVKKPVVKPKLKSKTLISARNRRSRRLAV